MRTPSFERINKTKYSGQVLFAGARNIHPNPKWFKYYWFVFTAESLIDGDSFFSDDNKLSFSEFESELARVKSLGLEAWIYNIKLYRLGEGSPFDEAKLRAKGITNFAPSFDEDQEPMSSQGYK